MNYSILKEKESLIAKLVISFATIGTIVFFVLVCLSHYYAIKAGYDWRVWELSELVLYGQPGKALFNSGIIIVGICLLPILLFFSVKFEHKNTKIIILILGLITGLSLIGIGAISEDIYLVAHYVIAIFFYIAISVMVIYFSIITIKYKKEISIGYSIFGFIAAFTFIFHIISRFFFGGAFTQRIAIILCILYLLLISGKILLKSDSISENVSH
ncbi:MAG: DUF998 domain-containing protein [Asgard group archaeon]|nr:DUF998 domain-containing protein [Asgard group archaeon]